MKKLVTQRQVVTAILKPHTAASTRQSRSFSSQDEQHPLKRIFQVEVNSRSSAFVWPETRLGLLEPKDSRFPLPGLVGSKGRKEIQPPKKNKYAVDLMMSQQRQKQQLSMLEQFVTMKELHDVSEAELTDLHSIFHYSIQECPYFLKIDLQVMFPDVDILNRRLTVITLSLKNEDSKILGPPDMVSRHIEDLCNAFRKVGCWTNFIDSNSGKLHFLDKPFGAASYEAMKRYRSLGLELESYSGCKLISHKKDSTLLGCVVTDADPRHPLLLILHSLFD